MILLNAGSGQIDRICSKEASRYAITDAYFDADKGRLVATNGLAMVVTSVEAERGEISGMVPVAALRAYWAALAKVNWNERLVGIFCFKENVVVSDLMNGGHEQVFPRGSQSATFPNYEAVLPAEKDVDIEGPPTITFDINLLVDLVAAIGLAGDKAVSIWASKDPKGGSLLVKTSAQGPIGVLMPMRPSSSKWLTTIQQIDERIEQVRNPKPMATVTEMPSVETAADEVAEQEVEHDSDNAKSA